MIAREGRCNHFNGLSNKTCDAGVVYETILVPNEPPGMGKSFPCLRKYNISGATCAKCEYPTAEQLAASKAEESRKYDLLKRGLSHCCEAPINESQVIQSGRHKGHGPRFCSKCGTLLFLV